MKTIVLSGLVVVMLVVWALGASAQETTGASNTALAGERFKMVNEWLSKNNLALTVSPDQALIEGQMMVTGEGLPAKNASSPGEKRLTAERAATVLAYRNLAEMIYGVAVAGDTYVRNAADQYDLVRAAVTGFVKGAEVVHKEYNEREEVALVIVKVGRGGPSGFGNLLYGRILGDPTVAKGVVEEKPAYLPTPMYVEAAYDGLIIDATGENFRPALINRIYTLKGEVLYDPSKVEQKILVEKGCGEYTNSVEKARAALGSRGVKNPLVVKAAGTGTPTDLKVSDDDAVKIFSADQKAGFLTGAKVAFVLR